MTKFILALCLVFCGISAQAQSSTKQITKALNKVYSKSELNAFEKENGGLALLIYAYEHAVFTVNNNGGKETSALPISAHTNHFTDFGVQIQPYNQYFRNENPQVIVGIKSLYILKNEMILSESKAKKP